ncbi:MAG: EamA family transporter RarD [Candidatus Aminicenantes bacterium]
MESRKRENWIGMWYAIAAYVSWGVLPLYWKTLKHVPAREILAYRIIWSFIFLCIFNTVRKRWPEFRRAYTDKRDMLSSLVSAVIIGAVWFIYILAMITDHVVEASMGYYINPLISVVLGMIFLKERLTFWQNVAFLLAILGVAILTIQYGRIPWIALSLAVGFGLYGLMRKTSRVGSIKGLTAETAILSPLALVYVLFLFYGKSSAVMGATATTHLLLMGAGIVTAVPLVWFAKGARRIPLSMIGFFQYLAPTISLLLGIFVFKEPFTTTHLVSFGLIWVALIIYTITQLGRMKQLPPKAYP